MRTLYLLRHAESSWKDQFLRDFDRPLKKRGRKAAEAIGWFLRSENIEDEKDTALLVGHNPNLEELLQFLTGQSRQMPTAALAKITIEGYNWSRIGEGKSSLDWLVTPKDVSEA